MVSVNIYNLATEGNFNVAKNFKVREFKSDSSKVLIHPELPDALQVVRDEVGESVNLTNGYRTDSHNKRVGGATNSYHTYGMAADIYVNGYTPVELAKIISSLFTDKYCIIAYPKKGIVHFDVRSKKYWALNNGKEKPVSSF